MFPVLAVEGGAINKAAKPSRSAARFDRVEYMAALDNQRDSRYPRRHPFRVPIRVAFAQFSVRSDIPVHLEMMLAPKNKRNPLFRTFDDRLEANRPDRFGGLESRREINGCGSSRMEAAVSARLAD